MDRKEDRTRRETYYPGEAHFHYKREERYKNLDPKVVERLSGTSKKRWKLFRGNKALLIILADIVLICVIYFGLTNFLERRDQSVRMDGYAFTLTAFEFDDTVFSSLKVRRTDEPADTGDSVQSTARVRFFLDEQADSAVEVEDLLPVENDQERIFRAQLPRGRGKGRIFAEIDLNGEVRVMKSAVEKE